MQSTLMNVTYEVELEPGEQLALPLTLINSIGAGRWVITIRPYSPTINLATIRTHGAFLNSYAPEDEGIYDDYPAG